MPFGAPESVAQAVSESSLEGLSRCAKHRISSLFLLLDRGGGNQRDLAPVFIKQMCVQIGEHPYSSSNHTWAAGDGGDNLSRVFHIDSVLPVA